jgi:hypothetical protein
MSFVTHFLPISGINNAPATEANFNTLVLNGTTQYANIADHASLDITAAITFGGWVYVPVSAANAYGRLINKWDQATLGNQSYGSFWEESSDTIYGFLSSTGSNAVNVLQSGALTKGQWHHYMYWFNGLTSTLYIDGAVSATITATYTIFSGNKPVRVGLASTSDQYFIGSLTGMFVLNRAATPSELTELYNGGLGIQAADLTAGLYNDMALWLGWNTAVPATQALDQSPIAHTVTYGIAASLTGELKSYSI